MPNYFNTEQTPETAKAIPYRFAGSKSALEEYLSLQATHLTPRISKYWSSMFHEVSTMVYDTLEIMNKTFMFSNVDRMEESFYSFQVKFESIFAADKSAHPLYGVYVIAAESEDGNECTGHILYQQFDISKTLNHGGQFIFGEPVEAEDDMVEPMNTVFQVLEDGPICGPFNVEEVPDPLTRLRNLVIDDAMSNGEDIFAMDKKELEDRVKLLGIKYKELLECKLNEK